MKRIIITGGCGGIGYHLSKAFIDDGYIVSIIGRNQEKFYQLFGDQQKPSNVTFSVVNVSLFGEVKEFFNNISIPAVPLHALINVAGVQAPIGTFEKNNPDVWVENIMVNLIGTANLIRSSLSQFKIARKGKIINFSGGGSTSSRPNFSAYSCAKTAVVRLTEILAEELGQYHIAVNAVAPGAINTNMLEEIIAADTNAGDDYNRALKQKERGGDPLENVVDLCRFLTSDDAEGISGKLISAVWDDYRNRSFVDRLRTDRDFCCLRRIDSNNFDIVP